MQRLGTYVHATMCQLQHEEINALRGKLSVNGLGWMVTEGMRNAYGLNDFDMANGVFPSLLQA